MVNNGAHFENFEVRENFPGVGDKILLLTGKKIVRQTNKDQLYLLAMQDITEFKSPPRGRQDLTGF